MNYTQNLYKILCLMDKDFFMYEIILSETIFLQFMIDLNNRQQVSAACIQLLTVLQDKQLMNIPVLILLNKM